MKGALVFTTHALRRMLKHGVRSGQIREVLEKGERIESYPDDTPQDETIVITGYEPDPNEWESDFKTRKGR